MKRSLFQWVAVTLLGLCCVDGFVCRSCKSLGSAFLRPRVDARGGWELPAVAVGGLFVTAREDGDSDVRDASRLRMVKFQPLSRLLSRTVAKIRFRGPRLRIPRRMRGVLVALYIVFSCQLRSATAAALGGCTGTTKSGFAA
jgi:hypothetical protein